jgi:hypothetical protein
MLDEHKRASLLAFINDVRNHAIKYHHDNQLVDELNAIQKRVENAGVLETYFKDFGLKEGIEIQTILLKIRAAIGRQTELNGLGFRKKESVK